MSRRRAELAGRAADRKVPQYRKRVPLAAKPFKNGSPLLRINMIARFERSHAQGGQHHAATASHAKISASADGPRWFAGNRVSGEPDGNRHNARVRPLSRTAAAATIARRRRAGRTRYARLRYPDGPARGRWRARHP